VKRFWRAAAAAAAPGGWTVELDGKPVRTPAGAQLILPTERLAEAIADEWAAVDGELKPGEMRLTGLANAAIDRVGADHAAALAAYAATDLLCYRANGPPELAARQAELWNPLLTWAAGRYGVQFTVTTGLMPKPQPPATMARLAAVVGTLKPFELAGLHPIVTVSGSLVIGLALWGGALGPEGAWEAGQLDELWQAEQWGEDALAAKSRADRKVSLLAGARMLELIA